MSQSYETLPDNLPVPEDDGACDHLTGLALPDVALTATNGDIVNPSQLSGPLVIYCYPMTGKPGVPLPDGWDQIPGARGCTPQSCAFRDFYGELTGLGATVYGLSTQTTAYQQEMADRLHLPFAVLSDVELTFSSALGLPTFEAEGKKLLKRVTLIINDGVIEAVHYPVFPSDSDPDWVIAYLEQTSA